MKAVSIAKITLLFLMEGINGIQQWSPVSRSSTKHDSTNALILGCWLVREPIAPIQPSLLRMSKKVFGITWVSNPRPIDSDMINSKPTLSKSNCSPLQLNTEPIFMNYGLQINWTLEMDIDKDSTYIFMTRMVKRNLYIYIDNTLACLNKNLLYYILLPADLANVV